MPHAVAMSALASPSKRYPSGGGFDDWIGVEGGGGCTDSREAAEEAEGDEGGWKCVTGGGGPGGGDGRQWMLRLNGAKLLPSSYTHPEVPTGVADVPSLVTAKAVLVCTFPTFHIC